MNNEVQYGERVFTLSMSRQEIADIVTRLADRLNADYGGRKPLFLVMLNGAFMFAADLMKKVNMDCTMSFVKLSSYVGMSSTGEVSVLLGLETDVRDRDVVIVEDIVESGLTMHAALEQLRQAGAKSVEICSFVFKPNRLEYEDARPKYVGKAIGDDFIIGYGLDLDGLARNLPEVYVLKN